MMNFFSNLFGYVLNAIYMLVQNYGLAIIIFSVLVKLLMLPLSIKQQKTLKKNEKVQKEMKILQIKHKDNPEMLNQEVMQLYRREKINPFGGCFSIVIQFILLISMFYLVRSPLTFMLKTNKYTIEQVQNYIVKEKEGEQSVISQGYPQISILKYIAENKDKEIILSNNDEENIEVEENNTDVENAVVEENEEVTVNNEDSNKEEKIKLRDLYINMNFLGLDLSNIPQENYKDIKVFIIPILYVISSAVSIKITSMATNKKVEDKDEESTDLINKKDKDEMDQAEMTAQMNKTMSWMMPILAVSISLVAPLGLALYWLVNNIIMIVERLFLNKLFSREDEEDA